MRRTVASLTIVLRDCDTYAGAVQCAWKTNSATCAALSMLGTTAPARVSVSYLNRPIDGLVLIVGRIAFDRYDAARDIRAGSVHVHRSVPMRSGVSAHRPSTGTASSGPGQG